MTTTLLLAALSAVSLATAAFSFLNLRRVRSVYRELLVEEMQKGGRMAAARDDALNEAMRARVDLNAAQIFIRSNQYKIAELELALSQHKDALRSVMKGEGQILADLQRQRDAAAVLAGLNPDSDGTI